jgi:C-terminal processing protease CtpA/Prc
MRLAILITLLSFSVTLKAQVKFNGNIEELDNKGNPVGWDLTYKHHNTYEVKVDSNIKFQGKYAISISSGNSKEGIGIISFPINQHLQGKILTLAGAIKTENITGSFATLWLRVNGENKRGLSYADNEKDAITGTTNWKEYMVQVPYNEGDAVSIEAGVMLAGKGKMWIDSLRLYLDYKPINEAIITPKPLFLASKDTVFSKSSGIDTILSTTQNVKYLTLLGELWGFLKYHHPAIANGDYNWDNQLFRILPTTLNCHTDQQLSDAMEKWVDSLGRPALCTNCISIDQVKNIAVKPDYGSLFTNPVFTRSLIDKLRFILANSNNNTNYYVDRASDISSIFKHEQTYNDIKYPDAGIRLLALYRYWNMVQYFSPNRKLITEGWNTILPAYIPQLIQANNQFAYLKTMVKLICTTHDTHAFITNDVYNEYFGNYRVPFQAKFIEDKLVVTGYYKDTLQVKEHFKLGDIITTINGTPVNQLVKNYMPVSSASNTAAALRDMPGKYLLKSKKNVFKFNLLRNSQPLVINQQAVEKNKIDAYGYDMNPDGNAPAYRLINNQTAYIFPGRYKSGGIDSIKKQLVHTKGIIVDMRGYPSGDILNDLNNFIKPDSSDFVQMSYTTVTRPGLFIYNSAGKTGNRNTDHYKGKVVVIVNERSQSAAEFATMAFQSAPNVTVIGSTTAGADGDITDVPLPGITTYMSGLGVYYPDGSNAQRSGVKINYVVKPTIKGIKNGKDELLEKARRLIEN